MIKNLIILWVLCFGLNSYAHSVSQVYYHINRGSVETKVFVDLPWTIKHELETFDSTLTTDKTRLNFDRVLKNYVKRHLRFISTEGLNIPLLDIRENKSPKDHVHGISYVFIYENEPIKYISNEMFCLTNDKQENINKIKVVDENYDFISTCNNTLVEVPCKIKGGISYWVLVLIPLLFIVILFMERVRVKKLPL